MRPHFRSWQAGLTLLGLAFLFVHAVSAQDAKGKRYALLVGINSYQHDKLPDLLYAVNDAKKLGEVLSRAGFDTVILSDETGKTDPKKQPTKDNIERTLEEVLKKCQRGDIVLLALAGHGIQFEKKNSDDKEDAYFCPQDARPFRDQTGSLVSLGKIYRQLDRSFAGMKVLLVDACRDDPDAARGTRSGITADLAPRPPQGVAALFSCRAGEKAFENPKLNHGVFFYHVIEGLKGKAQDGEKEVTFSSLAGYVNRAVPRWVGKHIPGAKQSPNLKADYSTEPVLVRGTSLGVINAAALVTVGQLTEALRETSDSRLLARLGEAHYWGHGGPVDYVEARSYFRKAADLQDPRGMAGLGWISFLGKNSSIDPDEGLKWFRRAAEKGDGWGYYGLGDALVEGRGVSRDRTEADRCYQRSLAAFQKDVDQGDLAAMMHVAFLYGGGRGVPQNHAEAMRYYRKIAEAGHAFAMDNIGGMYVNGNGVARDYAEALRWFRKGVDGGNVWAMNWIGWLHYNGWGVDKDFTEAMRWYRKAADGGNAIGLRNVGDLYFNGRGVTRDYAEALRWFRKAADRGSSYAMNDIGWCYQIGLGVAKDEVEALRWYRNAANLGLTLAMRNLADVYAAGRGVARDQGEANRWLRKAADLGDSVAAQALARPKLVYVPVGTNNLGENEPVYREQALNKLSDLIAAGQLRGYRLTSTRVTGTVLKKDKVYYMPLTDVQLRSDRQYLVVAAGDNDTLDLDAKIWNAAGDVVAVDAKIDPTAQVELPTGVQGTHSIYLRLYDSRNDLPCACAVAILEK